MKLQHFFFVLCISLAACTNDDEVVDFASTFKSEQSGQSIRSLDEAIQIAQSAACMVKGNTTRLSIDRSVDLGDIHVVKNLITRNATEGFNSDTLMYVINYTDGGFAVVSANPDVEGLLAVTEEGHYTGEAESGVEGFDDFMMLAKLYSSASREGDRAQHPHSHSDTTEERKNPMVSVKWGQRYFYGQYCPNGTVGCVPLAIAQLMTYHQSPTSISLTYDDRDRDTQILDWTDIRRHKLYYLINGVESSTYCTAADSTHNAISRLCRQLGELCGSTYYTSPDSVTSTSKDGVISGLSGAGYSYSEWYDYSKRVAKIQLGLNRPLIFIGYSIEGGHAWIADGYYERIITTVDTIQNAIGLGLPEYELNITVNDKYYNHFNWGWHGRNNGYFLDNVFNIQNYYQLDSNPYSPVSNLYNFKYDVQFIAPHL